MFQTVPQQFPVQQSASLPPAHTMSTLPPNTIMMTNAAGEQKPRKLRASCDACSRAKVKCDKVRPTCHRCGNMGICCNYSPSMRLGKPRKARNPDGSIIRSVSPATSGATLGPRPDMPIPRTTSHTAESTPEPSDPFFFAPPTPEYHYQDTYMSNAIDRSQSPYSEAGSYASGWSEDPMMFQSPTDMYTSMPSFAPPSSPYGHSRATSVQSQPEMFVTMDTITSTPPMPSSEFFTAPEQRNVAVFPHDRFASPQPMVPASLPSPPGSASLPSHDCTKMAFQTLNSLYAPPASHGLSGTSDGLPTLDVVLSTNKAAVDKLFVLLGCPCSANPHFSTTISFTITKILSWYQAVAGMHQSAANSPVITPLEAFTPTPISLGSYRLEGEDDTTLRTQHILSELRKIEKLIDKFNERYCKAASPAETGIDGGIYSALEALLRTRVRDTFKATMKSAPEEVKRQIASKQHLQQQRARTITI